jgi:hypothetical protein
LSDSSGSICARSAKRVTLSSNFTSDFFIVPF